MIGPGEVERNSDGVVFKTSSLGRALNLNVLQLPPCRSLSSSNNKRFYFAANVAETQARLLSEA